MRAMPISIVPLDSLSNLVFTSDNRAVFVFHPSKHSSYGAEQKTWLIPFIRWWSMQRAVHASDFYFIVLFAPIPFRFASFEMCASFLLLLNAFFNCRSFEMATCTWPSICFYCARMFAWVSGTIYAPALHISYQYLFFRESVSAYMRSVWCARAGPTLAINKKPERK